MRHFSQVHKLKVTPLLKTSPFPLLEERPTSSQMSMTSGKGRIEEKPKKTASATKKEKSAGKGGRKEKGDDKKKKKSSKTDVKTKKTEKEDESTRSNTSPMSSYSEMDQLGKRLLFSCRPGLDQN